MAKRKSTAAVRSMDFEQQPMQQFVEKAYLDYSMYVILDRALPHIADGLKPVQRRILYAMSELGLKASSKYKKSARTVGDVLGKFHPHSDSACYEAMVLMAQPFSYRYPLVDGQGNWGSVDDPKSFAAMRYTESRLSAFADTYLAELEQGTVDWQPNFDGTLEEPKVLPAQLPSILLNGTSGIAVGMATDIPPHNLSEVVDACLLLLDSPKSTLKDICKFIKAPDFPTGAEIISPRSDIMEIYRTGNGSVRMRATYRLEGSDIVITALPYQVSPVKILEQIAQQMQAKKLPLVEDLRDESDQDNAVRLVIVPKSKSVDVEQLMMHLFATTDLERNVRVNLNMIGLDGRPQVKSLDKALCEWLVFRRKTVTLRTQHRLNKVIDRLEVLDGLLVAFLNIDEVISIIRKSDDPKAKLMSKFKLSERQADAILDLRLRQLAKLEEIKITTEQKELAAERKALQGLLGSESKMTALIREELSALKDRFGDARRSKLVEREQAVALSVEERIASEPVTVFLSEKGWVRQGKGHDLDGKTLGYKSGDGFLAQTAAMSTEPVLFLDSTGRFYSVMPHSLPTARGFGEPLTTKVSTPPGAIFVSVLTLKSQDKLVLSSHEGYGFVAPAEDLGSKNKSGKQVIRTDKGLVSPVILTEDKDPWLFVVSQQGRALMFPLSEVPEMNKGKGNKLIQIDKHDLDQNTDKLATVIILKKNGKLQLTAGKKVKIMTAGDLEYYHSGRGKRGKLLPRGFQGGCEIVSV